MVCHCGVHRHSCVQGKASACSSLLMRAGKVGHPGLPDYAALCAPLCSGARFAYLTTERCCCLQACLIALQMTWPVHQIAAGLALACLYTLLWLLWPGLSQQVLRSVPWQMEIFHSRVSLLADAGPPPAARLDAVSACACLSSWQQPTDCTASLC